MQYARLIHKRPEGEVAAARDHKSRALALSQSNRFVNKPAYLEKRVADFSFHVFLLPSCPGDQVSPGLTAVNPSDAPDEINMLSEPLSASSLRSKDPSEHWS